MISTRQVTSGTSAVPKIDSGLRAFMLRVYNYMALGLGVTALISFYLLSNPETLMRVINSGLLMPLAIGYLVASFYITFNAHKMSLSVAQGIYWSYTAFTGVIIAPIVAMYTTASVFQAFLVTSCVFFALSIYGYTTRHDLLALRGFLIAGMIGIVAAVGLQFIFQSSMLSFLISAASSVFAVVATAYSTQLMKEIYYAVPDAKEREKYGVLGAMSLYSNFITIFINMLRFFGDRR